MVCGFHLIMSRSSTGPRLLFFLPLFRFFWHHRVVSQKSQLGKDVVPQPGLGPGRPKWSRGCKPRLSAISNTGARFVPDVGAVIPLKVSTAPTFFGSSSAALKPSSFPYLSKRKISNPCVEHAPIFFFFASYFFRLLRKPTKNFVDRSHWRSQTRKVISLIDKLRAYICRREFFVFVVLQNPPYGIRETELRYFRHTKVDVRQRQQMIQYLLKVRKFCANLDQFQFKLIAARSEGLSFLIQGFPRSVEV